MKHFSLFLAWALISLAIPLSAQETNSVDLTLLRKDYDERFRVLEDKVATLIQTQDALLERTKELKETLSTLVSEIAKVKGESARAVTQMVTLDQLTNIVEKLNEIDKKRDEDNKMILEKFKELAKLPIFSPPEPVSSVDKTNNAPEIAGTYKIEKGDSLSAIVASYNEVFEKKKLGRITEEDILKANPGMKPNPIFPGRIIKIPMPKPKP